MRVDPELPTSIKKHVNRLGESGKIGKLQSSPTWNRVSGIGEKGPEP
jgi:hypothetical protein